MVHFVNLASREQRSAALSPWHGEGRVADLTPAMVGRRLTVHSLGGDAVTGVLQGVQPERTGMVTLRVEYPGGWYRAALPGSYECVVHPS